MRILTKNLFGAKSRGLSHHLMDGYKYYYNFQHRCVYEGSKTNLLEVVKRKGC